VTQLFAAVVQRFGEVDVRLAALALCCHVANHVLRSVAWRNVLAAAYPERRVRLLDVGAAYAIGVALNAVLPGRGGDAAKVVLVRSRIPGSSVPTVAATMSVIVLFDMVAATLLVLVVCLTGAVPFAPSLPAPSAVALLAVVLVGLVVVLGTLAAPRLASRLRTLRRRIAQGGAILRTPRRYARQVVLVQAGAWTCRIAVVFFLLAAFRLPASVPTAGLVMVVAGLSTLVPLTPGGAGTLQAMLAYALRRTAGAAGAVSFSVGMQAGITVVNALLGVAAAMVAFRTLRPLAAVRSGLGLLGAR
jgi:uncharacterized membrane protein YbhN (UPF0104 family)